MSQDDFVRIWSYEHDAWWKPNGRGYTSDKAQAGIYPRKKAERLCNGANLCVAPNKRPYEAIRELNEDRP